MPTLSQTTLNGGNLPDELERRIQERTRELQLEIAERSRAEKNLQQQFTRIRLLNQITAAMAERQDFDSILRSVLRELENNLVIDFGAVLLLNAEQDSISIAATRFKPSPSQGHYTLRERESLPIADTGLLDCLHGRMFYAKDTADIPYHLFRVLLGAGLKCAIAVPLTAAGTSFGILLAARRSADAFSSGECEFFRMLSNHVALAANQARLYEQLQTAYEELKQTQEAVMQQERLRALGEMASGIAHDINNALSPIVVYSELILLSEQNLSDSTRRQLGSIKTAGDDIAQFVTRMRDFYRKREESDEFTPCLCNELVEQVIDLTRPRWHDMPLAQGIVITLAAELQPGLPTLSANPAELREALTNLILNAVDAMPSGGNLRVVTRRENAALRGAPPCIVIEVIDSGVGMDEVTKARCLEPFFSTKGQRGTGLGLAMVYGITERHGGRIEIESAVGKGTTMRMIIPVPQHSGPEVNNGGPQIVSAPMQILYIEDEASLRDLIKETLELDGHSVSLAEHGQAGVEACRAAARAGQPFDIVISDLGMPFMDGRQVADTLKKEFPQLPIVLLTGWGAMMKADGDHPANVDAILSKPPHVSDLREVLARFVSRTRGPVPS